MANPYFNATYYLTNNPDLNAAGINTPEAAWNHYVQYGAAEALGGGASRSPAPWFDIVYYLQNNADLATAGLSGSQLFEHFTTYGVNEGRAPSAAAANVNETTLTEYAAANEDLQDAFGIDDLDNITEEQYDLLAQHLYQFGYSEGRAGDPLVPAPEPTDNKLTVGFDHIVATSAGQTFTAPLEQAPYLGNVSNTLESGDIINAMGEGNKLVADLTFGTTGGIPVAPAISATTTNVQVVELRAQSVNVDLGAAPHGNMSNIDAENMVGVEEWWTVNSRTHIQIEDIRTRPEDTLIGMRNTDPEVGFFVYFDPEQLSNNATVSDSALTLTLDSISAPGDLTEVPVNGVAFTLGGESYSLQSEAIGTAANHAELLIALQEAAEANPALEGLQFTLNADNTITMVDPDGRVFVPGSWSFVNNEVPSSGDIIWDQQAGAPVRGEEPITTNVVLDNVGRTSEGGWLDIGSLGDGGVEVFNVSVDRDSWVTGMSSVEHLGTGPDEFLETVNLTSIGANGDLKIGSYVGDTRTGALDDRVEEGLYNVREVLNQGFEGDLSYGVELDGDAIGRYLDDADGVVQFTYEGGDGNDNITIYEEDVSGDNDFAMSVDLGAGDDRLNLTIEDARNVSVDGGEGNNTIAVAQSHGTSVDNTFAEFANFQTYEIERFANTTHNFESMQGVTAINIATLWGASTDLINVAPDAEVLITGKNQTLDTNSNNNQIFGDIAIDSDDVLGGDNTLRVTLQNTARLDGVLLVSGLEIGDLDGDTDPIRTLELVSAGRRDTVNVLFDLDAEGVNTFNLTGTQDLFVDLTAAANSTAAAAQRDNLVVNGAELEGTLDLDVDGDIITAINDASKTVTLTGTDNDDDVLGIDGSGLDITNNTTVNGFETVEFWGTGGEVNVTNFNGVEQYRIESSIADFEMNHMQGNENVWVDADFTDTHTLTFVAATQSNTNVLDIEYETTAAARTVVLEAQDFRTIQLDLGGADNLNNAYTVDLTLLDENGDDPSIAPSYDLVYARTLVITGGGDQGAAGVAGGVDTADLGTLNNVLDTIDLTGYVGEVTLEVANLEDALIGGSGRNVTIELNGYGADLTESLVDPTKNENIVTYKFTTDTVAAADFGSGDNVVVIRGFDAFNETLPNPIDVSNVSILDFKDLGVTGLADLTITQVGLDTHIASNTGLNFGIQLVGIDMTDLNNENFAFAV